jgi:hypothetical protein
MPDLFRIGALTPTELGYDGSLNICGKVFAVRAYRSWGRYIIETKWHAIGEIRKGDGWSGHLQILNGMGMPLALMEASDKSLIVFWRYEKEAEEVEKPYYMQKQRRKRKAKEGK